MSSEPSVELPTREGHYWARPQLTKENALSRKWRVVQIIFSGQLGGDGGLYVKQFTGVVWPIEEWAAYEWVRIEEPQ